MITVKTKENIAKIELGTGSVYTGSIDSDFLAEIGGTSDKVRIKRVSDSKYIAYDVTYTNIKDSTGTTIGTSGATCVSALNADYFVRPESVSVWMRFSGSVAAGEFLGGARILRNVVTVGSVTAGSVYVLNSSGWTLADADAAGTSTGILAVGTSAGAASEMLAEGAVKLGTNTGFSTAVKGTVLYVSTATGELTATAPSGTGDIVRVAGYVLDGASGYVYFSPSQDWSVV